MFPAPRRGAIIREGYLFLKKRYPSLTPSQRKFSLQASSSKRCNAFRLHFPARGEAAFRAAIRFASASIIRCRSAHLVLVQPNHLTMHIVLVVRTAASAAKPPRQTIASLYKSKVGGNCVRLPNSRQSDSEDRSKPSRLDTTPGRHLIPQAAQLFKCQSANAKPFSWGSKGAILFCEREWPLCPIALRSAGETRSPRSGNVVFTSCAPPISGIVPRSFFEYFRSRGFLPPACRGRSSSCRV